MTLKLKPIQGQNGKKSIKVFALSLFLFICVFSPTDPYNIKIPALFFAFLCSFDTIIKNLLKKKYLAIILIGVFFPIICVIQSIIISNDIIGALRKAYPSTIMLLVFVSIESYEKYKKYFLEFLKLEVLLMLAVVVLDITGIQNIYNSQLTTFIFRIGIGTVNKLPELYSHYKLIIATSPLIIFMIDDCWKKKDWLWVIISCSAMYLSGMRCNLVSVILYLGYQIVINWKGVGINARAIKVTIILACGLFGILFINKIDSMVSSIMSNPYAILSESIKFAQIKWFIEQFSDPSVFLFGKGLGAQVFEPTLGEWTNAVEMVIFYYLYEIGIFLYLSFMIFLFYPFSRKVNRGIKVAYMGFIVAALTNPFLITSTSYMAYLYVYSYIYKDRQERCKKERIDSYGDATCYSINSSIQ